LSTTNICVKMGLEVNLNFERERERECVCVCVCVCVSVSERVRMHVCLHIRICLGYLMYVLKCHVMCEAMLSEFPVTMAWCVLRLQMEDKTSRYEG
jgi:hypothetical protein